MPPWNSQAVRPAPDLDHLYGPPRLPRAKPGQAAIQPQELAGDGVTTVVHPLRAVFAWGKPREEAKLELQRIRASVEVGERVYKWTMARNGALCIGPATVTPTEWPPAASGLRRAEYLGHTTLIGGQEAPQGRIGGEFRRVKPADGKVRFVIDNNSGRYSEFLHLGPRHLDNVAKRFEQLGCPVDTQWIDMEARKMARRAEKAARTAAAKPAPDQR